MSAIFNPRDLLMQATPTRLLPITLPTNLVIPGLDQLQPNLDMPPTPTGFSAVGSLTFINMQHAAPTFTQGHGYMRTNIYGKIWTGGARPTFADAVKITSFTGQVAAHPTTPATTWHLWATWVSRDGIESLPAGGTNGIVAATGEDVERLVAAMTGPGKPFTVVNEPTTLADGTVVPAGTYTSNAYMGRFVAGRGQIGLLAVDDARIASASAAKLITGSVQVGVHIGSSNYIPGLQGWAINGSGAAELSNIIVRGHIEANSGKIGGNNITAGGIYSPNYQTGVSGWGLDYLGNAAFNSITLRGAIMGGAFQGYAWPANGGTGFYLGPPGLLLGNPGIGRFVQITEAGNFYAPGMSIENGLLTISQLNVIKTANVAGNAITVSVSGAGSNLVQAVMWVPPNETMRIAIDGTCKEATGIELIVDGVTVASIDAGTGATYTDVSDAGTWTYFPLPAFTMGIRDVFGGANGRGVVVGAVAPPYYAPEPGAASQIVFKALGTMR
ncbi:MAG: hypothetical protein JWQ22_1279 [Devosia sp.]|nr:hypothetical protein [Devosia sp.]